MNNPFFHWFYSVKFLLILSAVLCSPIIQGATFDNAIELDPILFVGNDGKNRYKFILKTNDKCLPAELAPVGACNGKGYQLHLGQQFFISSNPLVEASTKIARIEARLDIATSTLIIPHLHDSVYTEIFPNDRDREVNATFTLSSFPTRGENTEIVSFVFTITKLEELKKEPTKVGALEFFNGEEFEMLPLGPEGAVLTMRNGKPTWGISYQIGDEGPHGGTVFYVYDNGLHGFEAAPKGSMGVLEIEVDPQTGEQLTSFDHSWGCKIVQGANLANVGAGKLNTLQIIQNCSFDDHNYAALLAAQFSLKNDEPSILAVIKDRPLQIQDINWYLPSADELDLMREQEALLGLVPARYWSSTERVVLGLKLNDVDNSQEFAFSDQGFQKKENSYSIRPIRDF
jgi:hypothetical protein